MANLEVKLVKSLIGSKKDQIATASSLGLLSHGNAQKKKNPPNIHPGDIQAVTSIIIQIKIIIIE